MTQTERCPKCGVEPISDSMITYAYLCGQSLRKDLSELKRLLEEGKIVYASQQLERSKGMFDMLFNFVFQVADKTGKKINGIDYTELHRAVDKCECGRPKHDIEV